MPKTQNQERLITLLAMKAEYNTLEDAERARKQTNALREYLNNKRIVPKDNAPNVVIVGGGIIGLMTAYFMTEIGFKVILLEAKSFAAAASGRNGGAIMTLGRILEEVPYSLNSVEIWEQITKQGIKTHFEKNGHLIVARNELEKSELIKAYELYKHTGIKVALLNNEQMKKHVPFINEKMLLGLFSHDDAIAYPFTTAQSLIKVLKERGAKLHSHCPVTSVNTERGKITSVLTPQGEFAGDQFIFSLGPWTQPFCEKLGEQVKIRPRRSQIFATEIFRNRVISPFVSGNGIYLRQTHAGNIIFGGGGKWEIDGYCTENTEYAIGLQSKRFLELFPKFKNKKLLRSFAGTVELTPDHMPVMGSLINYSNGIVSAGYNGHGFGVSAAMGKFASAYLFDRMYNHPINETIQQMLHLVSVDRFKH